MNLSAGDVYTGRIMQSIYLIGYRGSGKTTVGRCMAERLGYRFVDADEVLEEQYGVRIRDIFANEGEAAFRDKESRILEQIAQHDQQVVATGGGVILREANRQRLRQTGWVVWLMADAETLWQRISLDPTTGQRRPNLAMGGLEEVRQMLAHRHSLYAETAHFSIPVGDLSADSLASCIISEWESSAKSSG